MQDQFLTPEDLATRWSIEIATLSQWRWNGRGPSYLKIGRKILYHPDDIERFEQQQRYQSTAQHRGSLKALNH